MNRTDALYQSFLDILREELVPAMGCTEPIAIAYAAAQARAVLGKRPERVRIEVSGNIIKNVKSVIVPHTGSMHGIAAAAAAGIIAGREDRELEVLSEVTQAQIEEMRAYLKELPLRFAPLTHRSFSTSALRSARTAIRPRPALSAATPILSSCCTAQRASSTARAAKQCPSGARTGAS